MVANYPFATIEPNIGVVPVPDERLNVLADIVQQEILHFVQDDKKGRPPIIPALVTFVDIAGLVKDASQGEGLGNKFLSHIREVHVICHVIRAFTDEHITKGGSVNPREDYAAVETELVLADLQTIQNVLSRTKDTFQKQTLEKLYKSLDQGTPAREIQLSKEEQEFERQLFLLSQKPEIVVMNISEQEYGQEDFLHVSQIYSSLLGIPNESILAISAKIEAELSQLNVQEQKEYLAGFGLKEAGLERLIQKAYHALGLISFLTAGEKEVRAWTIQKGMKAVDAAGVIHTDFTRNFIKAEVVSFDDFVKLGGWKKTREVGKTRFEGRDYVVQDGDVVEFKIGI